MLGTANNVVPSTSVEHHALQLQEEQLANELRKVGYLYYGEGGGGGGGGGKKTLVLCFVL